MLEAISEDDVLALEDPNDADGDGISGRAQMVTDPVTGQARLGRFGNKASNSMLSHHIASALNTDMGVTTSLFPNPDGQSSGGTPELSDDDLDLMMRYVALLGVHARIIMMIHRFCMGNRFFMQCAIVTSQSLLRVTTSSDRITRQTIRPTPICSYMIWDPGSPITWVVMERLDRNGVLPISGVLVIQLE